MSNYLIRQATIEDASRIAEIQVKTWQCAYKGQMPDSLLDNLSVKKRTKGWEKILSNSIKDTYAYVEELNGKIVGWCTGGVTRDKDVSEKVGELYGIYIDPEYIGKGGGSSLMKQILATLKKDGYQKATLWVLTTNKKTREFYEKKGWRVEGQTKEEQKDDFTLHETRYILNLE